jgi:hypothetical protein
MTAQETRSEGRTRRGNSVAPSSGFSSATSRRYFIPVTRGIGALPASVRRVMMKAGLMVLVVAHT